MAEQLKNFDLDQRSYVRTFVASMILAPHAFLLPEDLVFVVVRLALRTPSDIVRGGVMPRRASRDGQLVCRLSLLQIARAR